MSKLYETDLKEKVLMRQEYQTIPTYEPYEPNKNPIFFERRAYQGADGKVYPLPFTDRLRNEAKDKVYLTGNLENKYLKIMVLPEIGGRVHIGLDKINNYNFIYHNTVIKPARIGLCGPWICGGIEFNWPQHHRPTTFMPVDMTFEENEDGSKTIWVGEIEPFNRTQGMAGITLYPDKAYMEVKVRIHNRTPLPQTYMWWANLGVHVNENYRIVFPPDIGYLMDHDRRAVSSWPIIKGTFYGYDYGAGVDGSWFKNIPVSSSFMAMDGDSKFDFMSGYDFGVDAGVVHVANHHIAVGKKLFTWGSGNFGEVWCANLTDKDGPYVEIMTGVYTDNQPDFSWIMPYETKTFEQYWYPIRKIGTVKNASVDAAMSMERNGDIIRLGYFATSVFKDCTVILKAGDQLLYEQRIDISPETPFLADVKVDKTIDAALYSALFDSNGRELVGYREVKKEYPGVPEPRKPVKAPQEIESNEELYLNGLHIEQYRQPHYDAEPYYEEALRRDPGDSRCNNALGLINLRKGYYEKAVEYFKKAISRQMIRNTNPYDGEPLYNLGLVYQYMGRYDEAYDAFYKSVWNYSCRTAGYYALSGIDCIRKDYQRALEHINKSLITDSDNTSALTRKSIILRKLGLLEEADSLISETVSVNLLNFEARFEKYMVKDALGKKEEAADILAEIRDITRNKAESWLDIALGYGKTGLWEDAITVLKVYLEGHEATCHVFPMIYYYMAAFHYKLGMDDKASEYCCLAETACPDYCFPNRLESIEVLETAKIINPSGAKAYYYLGNLFYDKKRYKEAIENWEISKELDGTFPTVHRNLAIAYYEKLGDIKGARECLEKAFELDKRDSWVLYELLQMYKNIGIPVNERLALFNQYRDLVEEHDECYIEMIKAYFQTGNIQGAHELLKSRKFNPYEGGEGQVVFLHKLVHLQKGKSALNQGNYEQALNDFRNALEIPDNYREGRRHGDSDADVYYYMGLAYEKMIEPDRAKEAYERAVKENGRQLVYQYYQSMALRKLGREEEAVKMLEQMAAAGLNQVKNSDRMIYFGTGLPTSQPFDADRSIRGKAQGYYLAALACKGLGKKEEETEYYKKAVEIDPHQLWLEFAC
ncbi:MAG: DUF5107 domain-containing protein [Clostridiaceae bacterium]|nr:DUF5107 domain-containing protein [Clostridiaceae bacterium]